MCGPATEAKGFGDGGEFDDIDEGDEVVCGCATGSGCGDRITALCGASGPRPVTADEANRYVGMATMIRPIISCDVNESDRK
jgi:hypothetical protein